MQLFYCNEIEKGILSEEESRHCVAALRRQVGDVIDITDGKGYFYKARLRTTSIKECTFSVEEKITTNARTHFLHLAISPTKNADRIEWLVEKCVEVGIDKISFVETQRTERAKLRLDRLEKIAVSAMKQSLQSRLPTIEGLVSFKQIVQEAKETQRFIAYIDETQNYSHLSKLAAANSDCCVLIGPEGDFTDKEVALAISQDFQCVSLGNNRLRTETAGLYVTFLLSYLNE